VLSQSHQEGGDGLGVLDLSRGDFALDLLCRYCDDAHVLACVQVYDSVLQVCGDVGVYLLCGIAWREKRAEEFTDRSRLESGLFLKLARRALLRILTCFHGARRDLKQHAPRRQPELVNHQDAAIRAKGDNANGAAMRYDLSKRLMAIRQLDRIDAQMDDFAVVYLSGADYVFN